MHLSWEYEIAGNDDTIDYQRAREGGILYEVLYCLKNNYSDRNLEILESARYFY